MADKQTTTTQAVLTFTLQNGSNQTTRTISLDTNLAEGQLKDGAYEFKQDYLANYKYGIQPTGWRDSDDEEDAYECINVECKRVVKTEVEYDLG